ncbi:MAG: DNA-binding NtrC family response regulator [bacterium]|jgi:DNA-binding NtrC family response regulator
MDIEVVVVDDEKSQTDLLSSFLKSNGYKVTATQNPKEALIFIREKNVDLVITDFRMPELTGLELLKEVRSINPDIAVIMLSAYGDISTAVEVMKSGADEYLAKPVNLKELLRLLENCIDRKRLVKENRLLKIILKQQYRFENIIGNSGAMVEVMSLVSRVAVTNATVLIRGESGTGKELVSKAIHFASQRVEQPFVKINCAAIPESLLESELFGHIKGSFTGAINNRKGKFEEADSGTIFLDEIGEISLTTQSKLLRVLQEKELERVGSNETIKVNVRVVAATNKNLEEAIINKEFREDLYYRLSVVPILIPPIRKRREDIPPLIEHFIQNFSKENNKVVRGITQEAKNSLIKYNYPGNIRELENIIERAIVICRQDVITLKDLPMIVTDSSKESSLKKSKLELMTLEEAERRLIEMALKKHRGVQTRAAKELGISERALRYKLKIKKILNIYGTSSSN